MPKTPLAQADRLPLPLTDNSGFSGNLQRCLLGTALSPENNESYQRLLKTLLHGASFQFILAEIRNELLRDQLIATLDQAAATAGLSAIRLDLGAEDASFDLPELENRLLDLAQQYAIVHLCGYDHWLTKERWQALNIRRDTLAENCRVRLLCWLAPESIRLCAEQAPDLWSWRSGVYDFTQTTPLSLPEKAQFAGPIDNRSLLEGTRRIAQIRAWLLQNPADDLRLPLQDELAELLVRFGQLDEALRIRIDEQLPVFEKLGDVRSRAVTLGKIADIHQTRGELDEALRIRIDEQLPVFEKLGDVRSRAVALGKIADIHQARGQFDEALRIHIDEEMPVYEKFGDLRERAVGLGKIADIHQARGQLDEALRIRIDEQLPVFEKLGDVRSRAVTFGKIADIHQARGQLDEAQKLHEECLSVAIRLGDIDMQAHAHYSLASIILDREGLRADNIEKLLEHLREAFAIVVRLQRPDGIGSIGNLLAQVLAAVGAKDEALQILAQADAAWALLGYNEGSAAVATLRHQIEATPEQEAGQT